MTTTAVIEEQSGQLKLVPTSKRGGAGASFGQSKRKARSFIVPHLEVIAGVLADEVQNVRAFGSETETQTVLGIVNQRMAEARASIEATHEYHRIKALQGSILDADGSTLFDLFTEFDVTQQTYTIGDGASVRNDCVEITRLSERALGAVIPLPGEGPRPLFRGICGDTFFDALIEKDYVVEALKYQASAMLRGDLRGGFEYGGITWENYRGRLSSVLADVDDETKDVAGSTVSPFVADDEAYVVPMVANLCRTYWAPADYQETVNQPGVPFYAKQAIDKWGKQTEIQVQSNPLHLVLRPQAIIKVGMGT
jgi:hypothetical protein